jgi:RNA polymerase sigma factor (sigma-70 family)
MPRGRPKKSANTKKSKNLEKNKNSKKITKKVKPTFEESIDVINTEILKRKAKWNLTVLAWMDFSDVSQILRIHIYKKWDMYDAQKPLAPWVNRIISNQIKNLIRNNYGNYARPCLKCAAAESSDLCTIYKKQGPSCPLYANWQKTKKRAHDAKLPVSLEDHPQEVFISEFSSFDVEKAAPILHEKMKEVLKPSEWKVYEALYIDNKSEEEVAKIMKYKTNEANRVPGYKQIKNIKKSIINKVKKVLEKGDLDLL